MLPTRYTRSIHAVWRDLVSPRAAATTLRATRVLCIATMVACGGGEAPTGQQASAVASVVVSSPVSVISVGETVQLNASVRDRLGKVVADRTLTWTSSAIGVASVSSTGLVTAASPGSATITAAIDGKSGTVVITVSAPPAGDLAIVGVEFTQGVQDADGSIPMVLAGDAAAVNVLIRASVPTALPMQVVLRLFNGTGDLVRADTAVTKGTLGASATYSAPSAQFLLPATALHTGLRWQVVRDPRHAMPDDSAANDVFPLSGTRPLATVDVPTLNVRFVPIVLSSHNDATGQVSDGTIPEYLRTLKSIYPIGRINAHVGTPFVTAASFGTAPRGGEATFWTQVLSELDLARIADPTEPDAHWYGVIAPPAGFNFTAYGGFSYIPSSGTATGPHTRTSTGVQLNWFSRPTQARDLVAHELGHGFGRSHAPCGAAGSPLDANFPITGGTLDIEGHDVYSWASGLASSAATVPASTGDVMGYCFPVWASTYTYRAILQFRQPTVLAARANVAPGPRIPVLVVRGSVNGTIVNLHPAFTLNARPSLPESDGPYRIQGVSADGRVLFSYTFEPAVIDHAPDVRHFTVALPSTPQLEESLNEIRLYGPAGETRLTRPAPLMHSEESGPAVASRTHNGMVSVSCRETTSRGVLILDAGSGAVLGSAAAATAHATARPGTLLTVLCSDGVRTSHSSTVAPN